VGGGGEDESFSIPCRRGRETELPSTGWMELFNDRSNNITYNFITIKQGKPTTYLSLDIARQ